jgi:spore maturation protein SpmA
VGEGLAWRNERAARGPREDGVVFEVWKGTGLNAWYLVERVKVLRNSRSVALMLLAILCLYIAFQNVCQRSGPSEVFPRLIIVLIPHIIHTLAVTDIYLFSCSLFRWGCSI